MSKNKKKGAALQPLLGIKGFGEYGIQTERGELIFFSVVPTNISVLSPASVERKIQQLTTVLSVLPDLEIICTDAAECFGENKAYLGRRIKEEKNEKIKELLKKDGEFLGEIQTEMATARQFLIVARCKEMKKLQVFQYVNNVEKILSEQGFESRRVGENGLKHLIALYLGTSLFGENIPDTDGSQYFNLA